jgi:uncharacterized protein (UPF0276 family)
MSAASDKVFPFLGFGLGLRSEHYEDVLSQRPPLDWLEILTENYLVEGGRPLHYLDRIREHYPMVMHGVSMSLGSSDALDMNYLQRVKELARRVEPVWISDHLCWTGIDGVNTHDLLPLPYTQEAVVHVVNHIQQVQDVLGRPLLIENLSSYLTYEQSEMSEWEFLSAIVQAAGCYILLDVNNIYVSAYNHHFAAEDYLRGIPKDRVIQIHLAGHANHGDYIIDTHDSPVIQPVWDLYSKALQLWGPVSTMIERDENIPALDELLLEVLHAREIAGKVCSTRIA